MTLVMFAGCSFSHKKDWVSGETTIGGGLGDTKVEKRTILFRPFHRYDDELGLKLWRVASDGSVRMKWDHRVRKVRLGVHMGIKNFYMRLVESNYENQTAKVIVWRETD